jgi:hypothetical protein
VQVIDAVAFFQHAGVAVPSECIDNVATARKAVQSMLRMELERPASRHAALAKAVEELIQEAGSPANVEARTPHMDQQALAFIQD